MSMGRFLRKLQLLLRRERFRDELTEEMAFHRAAAEKAFVEEGMDPEAAKLCGEAAVWECDADCRNRVTRWLASGSRR